MHAYTVTTEDLNIRTVLPGSYSFQESFDQFVAEFETGLNRVSGRECEGWDEDCAGLYGRDGDDFKIDVAFDSLAWEWN